MFSNPIIGSSGVLVREEMRSANYVPLTSGWQITAAGDAEFNDATILGVLLLPGDDNSYIKAYVLAGESRIEFRPPDVPGATFIPGFIRAGLGSVDQPSLVLDSGYDDQAVTNRRSRFTMFGANDINDYSQVFLESDSIFIGGNNNAWMEIIDTGSGLVTFSTDPGVAKAFSETDITTTSTTFGASATVVSTTFVAPSSGEVFITVSGAMEASAGEASLGYQVREDNAAGAIVQDADDSRGLRIQGADFIQASYTDSLDGLTPGDTYYIQCMQRSSSGASTATYFRRRLMVAPHGAY